MTEKTITNFKHFAILSTLYVGAKQNVFTFNLDFNHIYDSIISAIKGNICQIPTTKRTAGFRMQTPKLLLSTFLGGRIISIEDNNYYMR